jgi:hypothetical protein
MNDRSRDQLRRRIGGALDRIGWLRTMHRERRLTPVRVVAGSRSERRPIRPVRSWERLVRI